MRNVRGITWQEWKEKKGARFYLLPCDRCIHIIVRVARLVQRFFNNRRVHFLVLITLLYKNSNEVPALVHAVVPELVHAEVHSHCNSSALFVPFSRSTFKMSIPPPFQRYFLINLKYAPLDKYQSECIGLDKIFTEL